MKEKVKLSKLVLPTMFCSSVIFIGFINIDNFKNSCKTSIEKNPQDIKLALSNVESDYTNEFVGKANYLKIKAKFSSFSKIDVKTSEIIELKNNYLTQPVNKINVDPLIDNTVRFRDYLEEKNIPFLYVQVPYKLPTDDDLNLPGGTKTYPNENADNLLEGLKDNNIQTLDLREEIKKDNLDHYSLFFKTDHHWTPYAGFWAHTKILDEINSILGINDVNNDYKNIKNYNTETYQKKYLGHLGCKVGVDFVNPEDFPLITPKFDTNFELSIPSKNIEKSGNFENTLINIKNLNKDNYFAESMYYSYLYGNYDYTRIKNNNINNNKKIVVLKDSFSMVTIPFLSLYYDEIHIFDLRAIDNNDMIKKINEINPDLVLCMYYPGCIREETFNFINNDIIKQLE